MTARLVALLVIVAAAAAWAQSSRLEALSRALPKEGTMRTFKELGITIGSFEKSPPEIEGGYNFRIPADLDRRRTDVLPWRTRMPGIHLNLPLEPRPGPAPYLFMSDQPEEVRDDRKRQDGTTGAVGVYARERIPARARTMVLMDHTNGTKRPLRMLLLFVPEADGSMAVSRRGEALDKDPALAGKAAYVEYSTVTFEPRRELQKNYPSAVVDMTMKPGETAVVHLDCTATVPGDLAAVIVESGEPVPKLEHLPVMHSIVWREEEHRLDKFLDKKLTPTRWDRILGSFQHSRGAFHRPDRMASIDYSVSSWNEAAAPVRVYSIYESIPGVDTTTRSAFTDNRGKYGARVGLRIRIKALPPKCREMALLVLNNNGTWAGRHVVTDGRRHAVDTVQLPNEPLGPLRQGQAVTLWRGEVEPGDELTLTTEPMANISVHLWYMLVPIKP